MRLVIVTVLSLALNLAACGQSKQTPAPEKADKKATASKTDSAKKTSAKADGKKAAPAKADGKKVAPAKADAKKANPGKTAPKLKADLKGKVYGKGVSEPDVISISQIVDNPEKYDGKAVRVQGRVTDVCPKRGCWFEMASDKANQILRFKVRDGVMVFPMNAKGKHAVAEGVVKLRKLTLEQSKRYAEYNSRNYGKKLDPASITKPMTVVRIDGSGAVIREKK